MFSFSRTAAPSLGALSVAFALATAGSLAAAPTVAVQIHNFAFVPAMVTVSPGTTVTWTNADEDPHTVNATDKSFKSAALDTDDKYTFTFTRPGDYAYFCSLHPHMTGHIVVKAR